MQPATYVQRIYVDDACLFAALFVFAAVQQPASFVVPRRAPLGPARPGGVVLLEDTDEENVLVAYQQRKDAGLSRRAGQNDHSFGLGESRKPSSHPESRRRPRVLTAPRVGSGLRLQSAEQACQQR